MKGTAAIMLIARLCIMFIAVSCSRSPQSLSFRIMLKENWRIHQSDTLNGSSGSVISGSTTDISGWYPATVPATIMGVLTANGFYKDIFMGDSLKNTDHTPFDNSWWYRTEFSLPENKAGQHVFLHFDGISYSANIWMNGTLVASRDSVYGTFRRFEFDVTELVKDSVNILAVEVFKQKPGDFGLGFVDWNPAPPDNNMGIWREVCLYITGDVAVKNTFVQSDLNTETLNEAQLTITTEIVNLTQRAINGKLIGKSEDFEFSIPVQLEARASRQIRLTPQDVEELNISNPRLWWCNNLGEPNLYNLNIQFVTNNRVSDSHDITFGIRKIEDYLTAEGHRGFKLNGKEILIKAGGWTDDIFLRDSEEKDSVQVQYVKHMNLNAIRFENIWGTSQHLYDMCDRYGILAMVGWSSQWESENYLGRPCDEYGGIKTRADMDLMVESLRHQIRYLQNHPAVFAWLLGSDKLPRPALEKRYRDLILEIDNRPCLAAASSRSSEISGPTGMKMKGPCNYVGPSYWYIDSVNGGAYGFNAGSGPGPQIPVMETIMKMIPENKRWPINEFWNYHCNPSENFGTLDIFNKVLYQRYGYPANLKDYLLKANVQCYEAMKGMFEAFRTNRPVTTGIVQWMLNSAWPSLYWQLYDYYLLPTPAYYAVRKANAPLQLIYNYGNNSIYAVNELLQALGNGKARIRMVDFQGRELLTEELVINLAGNASAAIYKMPRLPGNVFLALSLLDGKNNLVADNFYWLPGRPDIYDWEKTEWYYTPLKSSADFKTLNYLAPVEVGQELNTNKRGDFWVIETSLTNASQKPAFFINMVLKDSLEHTVFPAFWDDNWLSLMPGESRTVRCRIPGTYPLGTACTLTLSGWNVKEQIKNVNQ